MRKGSQQIIQEQGDSSEASEQEQDLVKKMIFIQFLKHVVCSWLYNIAFLQFKGLKLAEYSLHQLQLYNIFNYLRDMSYQHRKMMILLINSYSPAQTLQI